MIPRRPRSCVSMLAALLVLAAARAARAQEIPPPPPVGARGNALGLSVAAGVAQAWNPVSDRGSSAVLTGGTGGAIDLELGYRATPNLMLGVWAVGSQTGQSPSPKLEPGGVYAAEAGVAGTWHFRPAAYLDPWAVLGSGWRGEWFAGGSGVAAEHGLVLARARVGLDMRLTPAVAIGPDVGGSVDMFLVRELPGSIWKRVVANPLGGSLFVGIHGSFDAPLSR